MNRHISLIAAMTAAAGFAASGTAQAATTQTVHYQNASGFCQPALPVFEGNIRKRPTAIANEGTANAFVSCSMSSLPEVAAANITLATLVIYNRGASAVDVTCSMVNHYQAGGAVVPRTLSVPAAGREFFEWAPADFEDAPLDFLNFNCNLPVGADVGYGFYFYDYEIGT